MSILSAQMRLSHSQSLLRHKTMKKTTISLPCIARQYLFIILSLLFTSCGVLLDDAKFRGLWHLTDVKFYQYSEDFNSYLAIEGIGPNNKNINNSDLSADKNAPLISNFFGVKMREITMTINTNKTWTAKGNIIGRTDYTDIIGDSDSGTWEIDTYNNTVTITCPKGDADSTVDQLWSDKHQITNAWPMTSNNKFILYVKATDLGREYFEFEIMEKPVPDRIEKQRLDDYLSDKSDLKFNNDDTNFDKFCYQWYTLDNAGEYYYLKNNISPDDKMRLYKILSITEEDAYKERIPFQSGTTTKRFYAMEGTFKRDGYQDK